MFIVNDQKITVNYRRGMNILTCDIFARRHTFRVRDCEKNRLKCNQEQAEKLRIGKTQKHKKAKDSFITYKMTVTSGPGQVTSYQSKRDAVSMLWHLQMGRSDIFSAQYLPLVAINSVRVDECITK